MAHPSSRACVLIRVFVCACLCACAVRARAGLLMQVCVRESVQWSEAHAVLCKLLCECVCVCDCGGLAEEGGLGMGCRVLCAKIAVIRAVYQAHDRLPCWPYGLSADWKACVILTLDKLTS